MPELKAEQSTAPSVTTQSDRFDEINESISQTQKQTTAAQPITTSITSDSTIKAQEQTTFSTASALPVTTPVTSESTIKTREQTASPTTVPENDDKPESQSKTADSSGSDVPAADTLSADSVFTLPDGRTVKISDIERVLLYTNNPSEPDPEVTDTEDIIRVLSAFNDMEFGEPYIDGWVGGNAIVIYSGGECFSQISFSDDKIFLVELIAEDDAKAVYPVLHGVMNYEDWKELFRASEEQ